MLFGGEEETDSDISKSSSRKLTASESDTDSCNTDYYYDLLGLSKFGHYLTSLYKKFPSQKEISNFSEKVVLQVIQLIQSTTSSRSNESDKSAQGPAASTAAAKRTLRRILSAMS